MSKIAVTIIGAGYIGRIHADAWQTVPDAHIVSIVDPNRERADALANEVGAKVIDDAETAICDPEINVVSVCPPTSFHAQYTLLAIANGKHVLCEKPIALSIADGEAMIAAARAANVQLSLGVMRRHAAVMAPLCGWMREGHLGKSLMAHTTNVLPLRPKREMHDKHINGGPLIDMIVHFVDTWGLLFDAKPILVQAQGMTLAQDRPEIAHIDEKAVDTAAVIVRYSSGDVGNILLSWGMPPEGKIVQHQEFILGAKGRLNMTFSPTKQLVEWQKEDGETEQLFASEESMYHREVNDFAQAIRDEERTYASAEGALTALKVSLGALESIESGRPVLIG